MIVRTVGGQRLDDPFAVLRLTAPGHRQMLLAAARGKLGRRPEIDVTSLAVKDATVTGARRRGWKAR